MRTDPNLTFTGAQADPPLPWDCRVHPGRLRDWSRHAVRAIVAAARPEVGNLAFLIAGAALPNRISPSCQRPARHPY
jgi:hypothetical protein